jgi:hypothetical protein
LELAPPESGLIGTVQKVLFQGGYLEVQVCCQNSHGESIPLKVWQPAPYQVEPGQRVAVIPRRKE